MAVAEEAKIIHEELDTAPRDSNAPLERIHGLEPHAAEVEGDGGEQAVGADDGLLADVVEQEATRAVGVFGAARGEAVLADEGGGLVAETAGYLCAGEGAGGEFAVGGWVGGGDDFGEVEFGRFDVEVEEGD